jgi:O-antigen/teichoic acid export membrane protein
MIFPIRQRFVSLMTGNSLRARLIRGGLGSASIQVANRLLALGIGIVLARGLGLDGYGVYAYAFAIMSLLMILAEAGVPTLLMREVAASHSRAEWGLLRGALHRGTQLVGFAASVVSLVGLFVLWWFAHSLRPEILYTTALMLLLLPISALCKTVAHAIRGLHRIVIGQAVDMLIRPLLVLIIVAVVFLVWPEQRQPQVAMAAQLLGALVVLLIGVLLLRQLLPASARKADPEYKSRRWLKSALPFTLIGGAGIINSQADIVMLGWYTTAGDVGIYRVAVQGAVLLQFATHALGNVVSPQFARLYAQGDRPRLQRLAVVNARVVFLAAFPVALLFVFFGENFISMVFGSSFSFAFIPLLILSLAQLINAAFSSSGYLLNMTGNESGAARALWLAAAINLVLNSMFIPLWGVVGAAAATSISTLVWGWLLYSYAKKKLGICAAAFSRI